MLETEHNLPYLLSGLSGIPNTLGWRPLPALCVQQLCFVQCGPPQHGDLGGTVKPETNNESFDKSLEKVTVDLNSILTEIFMV